MTRTLACVMALGLATPAFADSHAAIDEAVVDGIMAKLTVMQCQMDADDIEVTEDGYELDDVICIGGKQFDIELDAELNETGRRAE